MRQKRPRIAIPARLDSGSGDARVIVAAKAFHSVLSLVEFQDLQPVIIDDPATDYGTVRRVGAAGRGRH